MTNEQFEKEFNGIQQKLLYVHQESSFKLEFFLVGIVVVLKQTWPNGDFTFFYPTLGRNKSDYLKELKLLSGTYEIKVLEMNKSSCLNCGKREKREIFHDEHGKHCKCECGSSFDIN